MEGRPLKHVSISLVAALALASCLHIANAADAVSADDRRFVVMVGQGGMFRRSLVAQFEHVAQHGDAAPRRLQPQDIEGRAH